MKYYETTNKMTGAKGCAALNNDDKTVTIYEGNPDGSDDKIVTIEEFKQGWEITPEA